MPVNYPTSASTNLGTIGAGGAAGGADALAQIIKQRMDEAAAMRQQQQQATQNAFEQQRIALSGRELDNAAAQRASDRADRIRAGQATALREDINSAPPKADLTDRVQPFLDARNTSDVNPDALMEVSRLKPIGNIMPPNAPAGGDTAVGAVKTGQDSAIPGVAKGGGEMPTGIRYLNPKEPPREPAKRTEMRDVPAPTGRTGKYQQLYDLDTGKPMGDATPAYMPPQAGGSLLNVDPRMVPAASADAVKVGQAFADSTQAAADMHTFTKDARAGNTIAYAYSPTEGVLTLNSGRGIKRVNMNEIQAYGGAGSAWERIKGFLGKQATGASIPEDVLKDIDTLHDDVLTNAARAYGNKLKVINQTYGSTFEPVQFDTPQSEQQAPAKAALTLQPGLAARAGRGGGPPQ